MKEALTLALDLAIMHHSDDGYAELRSKVRQLAKEALALTSTPCEVQPAPPFECRTEEEKTAFAFGWWKALETQRIAQPEQEPVARVIDDGSPEGATEWIPFAKRVEPLKTGDLLYTTPPKRPWVGLTDEDLEFWTKELGQEELGRGVLRAVADHLKKENT